MGSILGSGYSGSRFMKQWTAAILGMAALGLAALLLLLPRYRVQQQAMSAAREAVVKNNMRTLHVALAQYMAEDGRGYPVSFGIESGSPRGQMSEYLSSTVRRMENPLDPKIPAVAVSRKDPPFWPLYKPGQVVYVPLGIDSSAAAGYVIYGVGMSGPIGTVIECRPEGHYGNGRAPEQDVGRGY